MNVERFHFDSFYWQHVLLLKLISSFYFDHALPFIAVHQTPLRKMSKVEILKTH